MRAIADVAFELLNRILHIIRTRAVSFVDTVPPYKRVEGLLMAKEATPDGRYYLLVKEEMIEVDWLTFDTLMEGEALRIRSTRGYKAISIDRIAS